LGVKGNSLDPISTDNTTVNTKGGFYATARGRIGFVTGATGNVLIYGTGGWIGADLRSTVQDSIGFQTDDTGFRSGWTVGGGVEWAFAPQWSVKGEWLYYNLSSGKVGGVCCGNGTIQFFDIENKGNIVRVGLNYKFF